MEAEKLIETNSEKLIHDKENIEAQNVNKYAEDMVSKQPYGVLFSYDRAAPNQGYRTKFYGRIVLGSSDKCGIIFRTSQSVQDLDPEHLEFTLDRYADLKVKNISTGDKKKGIEINGEELEPGLSITLRKDDELKVFRWGIKWVAEEWYLDETQRIEEAKLEEEYSIPSNTPNKENISIEVEKSKNLKNESIQPEKQQVDIEDSFGIEEETEVETTLGRESELKDEQEEEEEEINDMNKTFDLISFSAVNTPKREVSRTESLKILQSSMRKKSALKRTPRYMPRTEERKSMCRSEKSHVSYMDPTESSIRRQRPSVRNSLVTPNRTLYKDLTLTQKLTKIKREENIATPIINPADISSDPSETLAGLTNAEEILKAALKPIESLESRSQERSDMLESTRDYLTESSPLETEVNNQSIIDTPPSIALEKKFERLSLQEEEGKQSEPRYNLRSSCKKKRLKKLETPLKEAIKFCAFNNVAYLEKKKIRNTLKKDIKARAKTVAERKKKKKLQTPLRKDIVEVAKIRRKRKDKAEESVIQKDLKGELLKLSKSMQNERKQRQKKILENTLKTPLRKAVIQKAQEKRTLRLRVQKSRMKTPIRKELQIFDKTVLREVETMVKCVVTKERELYQKLRQIVVPKAKPLEKTLIEKMNALYLEVTSKNEEENEIELETESVMIIDSKVENTVMETLPSSEISKDEKTGERKREEDLLSSLKDIFMKVSENKEDVDKYFRTFEEKEGGVDKLKNWISSVIRDCEKQEENDKEVEYFSTYESEKHWEGKHTFISSPAPTEVNTRPKTRLEDFSDFEDSTEDIALLSNISEDGSSDSSSETSDDEKTEKEEQTQILAEEKEELDLESAETVAVPAKALPKRATRKSTRFAAKKPALKKIVEEEESEQEVEEPKVLPRRSTRRSTRVAETVAAATKRKTRQSTIQKRALKNAAPQPVPVRKSTRLRTISAAEDKENVSQNKSKAKTRAAKKTVSKGPAPTRRSRRLAAVK